MKYRVLVLIPLPDHTLTALAQVYDLSYLPEAGGDPKLSRDEANSAFAVVTNGTTGCSFELLARLPALKVISSFGVGYEKIDVDAARARSVMVTYAPGANAATVADHAIGFALALSRGYCSLTSAVKAGGWKKSRGERATINGSTVGIIGMGRVGQLIAKRADAFDANVAYFARSILTGCDATYCATVVELADVSDFLIAACPGGKSTHHLVNYDVLAKLGPAGYLINVSRGTVVNTNDLIRALREGLVAGAGLDVLEEEPDVPADLAELENVLLTPHVAGRSHASFIAQTHALMQSLGEVADGLSCTFQVPEMQCYSPKSADK